MSLARTRSHSTANIVLVAGMARAGSMWTYNVAKEMLRRGGYQVLPEVLPINAGKMHAAVDSAMQATSQERSVWLFKIHHPVPIEEIAPSVRVICNYRDVRHALASYMRFTRCDFMKGFVAARQMADITDHYLQNGLHNVLKVPYSEVRNNSCQLLAKIAEHIGIDLPEREFDVIAKAFSRANILRRVQALEKVDVDGGGAIRESSLDRELQSVLNFDGSYRVVDNSTGFQSRHISTSADEEWPDRFSAAEQEALNHFFGDWLVKYGFEI